MNITSLLLPVGGVAALLVMLSYASRRGSDRRRLLAEALEKHGFNGLIIGHFDEEDWCVYGQARRKSDNATVNFNVNRQGDGKVHLQITGLPFDIRAGQSRYTLDLP